MGAEEEEVVVVDWAASAGGCRIPFLSSRPQDAYRSVAILYAISAHFLFKRGSSRMSESPARAVTFSALSASSRIRFRISVSSALSWSTVLHKSRH